MKLELGQVLGPIQVQSLDRCKNKFKTASLKSSFFKKLVFFCEKH